MVTSIKYNISGLVQGVGFRYFVYRHATRLGLCGYAKNLYDGSVEVLAEGDDTALKELYSLLKQGPSRSYIDSVSVEQLEHKGNYSYFEIK